MTNIVAELVEAGTSDAWIMKNIGMDAEELLRLKQLSDLQSLFKDADFSKSWGIRDYSRENSATSRFQPVQRLNLRKRGFFSMAKYNVTYKCGHEDRVELFGKMSVREWRLEQMAGELCPECQKKAEMERLKKQEEEDGLPSLTPSRKQIAWAMKLRDDAFNSLSIIGQRV